MKLHRYVDHQRLHIVTKDVISLSISVLLLFRHYISHKITFGAPSSGGVLCSACGAFICKLSLQSCELHSFNINVYAKLRGNNNSADLTVRMHWLTCVMLFACQQDQFSYDNAHIRECSG